MGEASTIKDASLLLYQAGEAGTDEPMRGDRSRWSDEVEQLELDPVTGEASAITEASPLQGGGGTS